MRTKYDVLLRALMETTAPRRILEIAGPGASQGHVIATAASAALSSLELVGAPDESDLRKLRARLGDRVRHRDGLTLNVVAALEDAPDLVIVSRDPNWYTVFHVLRLLERLSGSDAYPITLVHDTGWPYGRRDAYPSPDSIPGIHLQPHARSGVSPGRADLDPNGLHPHADHSLLENTERNGVRAAVEDFCTQSDLPLTHVFVAGLQGVSLLVDRRRLESSDSLAQLVRDLAPSTLISALVDELEGSRIDAWIQRTAQGVALARLSAERAELAAQLMELRAAHARTETALMSGHASERASQLQIAELEAMRTRLEEIVTREESSLAELRRQVIELNAQKQSLETMVASYAQRERNAVGAEDRRSTQAGFGASSSHASPMGHAWRQPGGAPWARRRQSPFMSALASAAPAGLLQPASLELASRRFAKLRRDPKLFLAHSRFEIARKLSRLL